MAVLADSNELVDLIRKSEVADVKRLDAFLQQAPGPLPAPPRLCQLLVQGGILTQFQADQLLQGRWKRFSIGKYRVLDKIGSGGMASVFLCEHKLMRRRVAVKVLPMSKANDRSALERFYREARAVAALDHPNIVHAYDIDQEEGLHFLVMEYVEGINLHDLVRKNGPLEIATACDYIRQAALGLDHAGQRGLVHRDIKPSNLLIDRKGVVKILDMGLARFFREDESILTKKFDDNVLGTADYLSPEQAEDSHDVDVRTDIYSLGATFYYLLTGKTVFGDGTVTQKLMWHCHQAPKPIPELRPEVPRKLWAIVAKMLAKKPGDRYQTPGALAEALVPFVPASSLVPPSSSHDAPMPPSLASILANGRGNVPLQPVPSLAQGAPYVPPTETPWEMLTPTTNPAPTKTSAAADTHSRRLLLIGLGVAVFSLTILVFGLFKFFVFTPGHGTANRPVLKVMRQAEGTFAFATIQQALRKAQPGDVIELHDDVHVENLVIEGGKDLETNVLLRAAPGKTIRWSTAKHDETSLLISLHQAKHFRIKGEGIAFDGTIDETRRLRDLIQITGPSQGLVFEDLALKGFARTGITLMNCTGSAEAPVRLTNLQFLTRGAEKPRAGIFFDANTKSPSFSDHIEITNCTFTGIDAGRGVMRKDKSATGEHIGWQFK